MTSYLRPDEQATQSEIGRAQGRDRALKGALKFGGTAALAAGTGMASRILPFLSEYIPVDLAVKGISKVSPKLGEFLKSGISKGLNAKEGLDFVKNQLNPASSEGKRAKDSRNIIEQYSPELHQFIDQSIRQGRDPIQAGALAFHDKRFSKAIDKMVKDHKTDWLDIVKGTYGLQGQEQQPQAQQPPPQAQQPQQGQPGQGQAALMAILQKLQQTRGAGGGGAGIAP